MEKTSFYLVFSWLYYCIKNFSILQNILQKKPMEGESIGCAVQIRTKEIKEGKYHRISGIFLIMPP